MARSADKPRKLNDTEKELILNRVIGLLRNGAAKRDGLMYLRTQQQLSAAQAEKFWQSGIDAIVADWSAIDRPQLTALLLSTSQQILSNTMAARDHSTALSAVNMIGRLAKML